MVLEEKECDNCNFKATLYACKDTFNIGIVFFVVFLKRSIRKFQKFLTTFSKTLISYIMVVYKLFSYLLMAMKLFLILYISVS